MTMVTHSLTGSPKLADPVLLDKIDKLFACNVGEYINLPQLVVVGDQSSGKSSVLEGLTKLAFPRDSGLCTRFATQIIFRRTDGAEREITASVLPASDADPIHASQLRDWKAANLQTLDVESFSKMMAEVHSLMGLSASKEDGLPTFSNDVLRLEICGPKEDHLSVIDVPGIFRNTTPGLTTKADKRMVRDMVLDYMKNPRSIMLTVVPANVDIATQEIIEIAREVDPDGDRTLGVLTKPDLVDKGAEHKVIDLVEGRELKMKLGWILVRNLSQQDLQDGNVDRDSAEEDFRLSYPWNTLDREKFGINALKVRLQESVTANARREFASVRAEISKKLKISQDALLALGTDRETSEQQASYLLDIITSFQDITAQALSTNYGANDIFDNDESLRLATQVANRNEAFADEMARWGHKYVFRAGNDDGRDEGSSDGEHTRAAPVPVMESEENELFEPQLMTTRKTNSLPDLEEILREPVEVPQPLNEDIQAWIQKQYRSSRGFEIGTFNFTLLSTLMKKQSMKWISFAHGYISDVITMVHGFILKALKSVCHDDRVCRNLLSVMMDSLLEKYKKAMEKVDFLLDIERTGTPMTLNHYLNDNLQKCRQARMSSEIAERSFDDCSHGEVIRVSDIVHQRHMGNVEHTVQDIHDILKSYYKVARKRFVDNVAMQAADYYLVTGPETPMKLFSPSFVNSLTKEQLEEIAGEDAMLRRRRQQLKKEIQELREGRKILF